MDPVSLALILGASNPGVQQGVSNILGNIPIVGGLFGGGGESDAEKALKRKQMELAARAEQRAQQQRLQAPQLQGSAQQLLAFDPMNQAMARMYGPESAFTPSQLAKMVQNPQGMPGIDDWAKQQGFAPTKQQGQAQVNAIAHNDQKAYDNASGDQTLVNYTGTDPEVQKRIEEYLRQKRLFDEAEQRRKDTIMSGFREPGPGPEPLQMGAPAPARRF